MNETLKNFLPYQRQWILDPSPLKLKKRSRSARPQDDDIEVDRPTA